MRNLLLSWMMKQMPTEMLIQALLKRLQSQFQMVPLSHGSAQVADTTCLAEEAELITATEAFKVAYRLLQFTTEALIACKQKNGAAIETSDAIAPIELMGELLTYSQTNLQG